MILDQNYQPMFLYARDFVERAGRFSMPFGIALEREKGCVKRYNTVINGSDIQASVHYIERVVKTMLWAYGGFKLTLRGNATVCEAIKLAFSEKGARAFDIKMMEDVYLKPFKVVIAKDKLPEEKENPIKVAGALNGCRIGFDAGGSDRKVTAVQDGSLKFMEEVVWHPKLSADPQYHIDGIMESINSAKAHLPRVDGIGVSTAGIVVDDEIRVASLFRKVPPSQFKAKIIPIYKDLKKAFGCPVKVANDGDVAALAGAAELKCGNVLGIAMGTSLAAGYIDGDGNIRGYINELAFAPADAVGDESLDEWSGDKGTGCMYMSQDAVIRLMKMAKIRFDETLSPAEKLRVAQNLVSGGDGKAEVVFSRMGEYFAYSILWFAEFYKIDKVLLLGRVASGKGGEVLLESAEKVLHKYESKIKIVLPDEKSRRLGQAYTAASLVKI